MLIEKKKLILKFLYLIWVALIIFFYGKLYLAVKVAEALNR